MKSSYFKPLKFLILALLITSFSNVFSQSKKEQIRLLQLKVDSIESINQSNSKIIRENVAQLEDFKQKCIKSESKLADLMENIEQKDALISSKEILISQLNSQINTYAKIKSLKNCIVIKPRQPIEGFDLEIFFYPKGLGGWGARVYEGSCVFNFIKEGNVFSYSLSSFNCYMSVLSEVKGVQFDADSVEVVYCPFQEVMLNNEEIGIIRKDLNFDNIPEVIFTNRQAAQRWVDGYIPFSLSADKRYIYDASVWFNYEQIDDMTYFNASRKEIVFSRSNGADSSTVAIYKAQFGDYGFTGYKFIREIPYHAFHEDYKGIFED